MDYPTEINIEPNPDIMAKKTKDKIDYALGLFADGQNLYVACLAKENKIIKFVDAGLYKVSHPVANSNLSQEEEVVIVTEEINSGSRQLVMETQEKGERQINNPQNGLGVLQEGDEFSDEEDILFDLEKDGLEGEASNGKENFDHLLDKQEFSINFVNALEQVLQKHRHSIKLGFTFQEPIIYYVKFFNDWGLNGVKLRKRISEELARENPNSVAANADDIQVLRIASGDPVAVINDRSEQFRAMLNEYENKFNKRLPKISFVESADISLINLINFNYQLQPEEITLVINMGAESSRLIFMQGKELYHVSARIDEGIGSAAQLDTLRNRIILEQDNLNLPAVDRMIIAGSIKGGVAYFSQMFSDSDKKVTVEEIDLKNLIVGDPDKWPSEKLAEFVVPIGNAWRLLNKKNDATLTLDLLPAKIRERQQIFRLGLSGWVVLLIIFATTLFFTFKVGTFKKVLVEKQNLLQIKTLELNNLQEIETEMFKVANKLDYYQKTYAVFDSMMANTKNWHGFLAGISAAGKRRAGTWITEISPKGPDKVIMKGYSLYRNRIARFSQDIGDAVLTKVEVAKIRDQRIYAFELIAAIPLKKYGTPERKNQDPSITKKDTTSRAIVRQTLAKASGSATKQSVDEKRKTSSNGHLPAQNGAPAGRRSVEQTTGNVHRDMSNRKSGKRDEKVSLKITSQQQFGVYYKQARELFERHKYAEAIRVYSALIESKYKYHLVVNCYYWIGECYFGLKKYKKAVEYFGFVAGKKSPKKEAALLMLGRSYATLGDKTQAMKNFDLALKTSNDKSIQRKANYYKKRLQ